MMKTLNITLFFLFFLLISTFVTMPASFVLKYIPLDKSVSMGSVQGPWWSFTIDWFSYKEFIQVDNHIALKPSCLLAAAVCFDIDNQQAHIGLKKSLLDKNVVIENSFLNVDFFDLNPLLKTMLVKPSGSLEIKLGLLELNQQTLILLEGDIFWHSIGVEGESFDLGSIQSKVKHKSNEINLNLSDQSNKLDLSGHVTINKNGFIESDVQLTMLSGFPSSLKTLVQSTMTKRGRDTFEYKSKISNQKIKRLKLQF